MVSPNVGGLQCKYFIIEIVYPMLINNQFKLNDKFNIIINFGMKEPDTELISYLMNFLYKIYPLFLNKMQIFVKQFVIRLITSLILSKC